MLTGHLCTLLVADTRRAYLTVPPHANLLQAGISITPTTQPGDVTSWPYAQVGGSITLLPDEMAQVGAAAAAGEWLRSWFHAPAGCCCS